MQKILKILIFSILVLTLTDSACAAGPGTTAANFLKIGIGARATAMGGAFTAIADDPTTLYWNPAGLAQIEKRSFSATYNSWLVDTSQGYLSLSFPALKGTLALGVNYMDMGSIEGRNEQGNPTGDFTASDLHLSLGYAFGEKFSFGFSAGMLQSNIEESKKSGFLGTAGFLVRLNSFSLGFAAQNLGGNLGEDPLPLILKAGVGAKFSSLTLAFDVGIPSDNDTYFCLGTEWKMGNLLALRAGYSSVSDTGQGFSAGAGFKIQNFSLDYAYVPYGDLGTTQRVSLGIEF